MGEVYMGKLILTARGLNSETGQKIIRKCLTEEEERVVPIRVLNR